MSPVLRQLLVLAAVWAGGQPGGAAAAGAQARVAGEPTDALRCWRRVDAGAVRVGEHFTMTLTCRVVETDRARAVRHGQTVAVGAARLDPSDPRLWRIYDPDGVFLALARPETEGRLAPTRVFDLPEPSPYAPTTVPA